MKKLFFFFLLLSAFVSNGQGYIYSYPAYNGNMSGVSVPADIQNGNSHSTRKIFLSEFPRLSDSGTVYISRFKSTTDSLLFRGLIAAKLNITDTGALSTRLTGAVNAINALQSAGYITSSALTPYMTTATATATFQPIGSYALSSHTHTFVSLTSKPTTIAGYGITDAYTKAQSDAAYATQSALAIANANVATNGGDIAANATIMNDHIANTSNPHSVTKSQVGLGNVDNTSDANKPVSTAQQTALNAKQATLVNQTNIKSLSVNGGTQYSLLGSGNLDLTVSGSASITRNTRGDSLQVGSSLVKDNDNPNNSPYYLRNNMRWAEGKLYDLFQGGTKDFNIVLLGDSKTEEKFIYRYLKPLLNEKYTANSIGWLQIDQTFHDQLKMAASPAFNTAAWTLKTKSTGGRGLGLYSAVSTVSSTAFGFANQSSTYEYGTFTDIDVWYVGQAGGGSFGIYIDGSLNTTVNTSLTTGAQAVHISGLTDVQHDFKITPSGANVEILGTNFFRTGVNGMRLHAIGQSGAQASDYLAADTAYWNPQWRSLSPDLVFIYLGTNNRRSNQSLSAFKTEMHNLIVSLKSKKSDVDYVLIGQADIDPALGPFTYTTRQYNDVLRQLAIEDTTAYFDIDQLADVYAVSSVKGFLRGDGIHESDKGAYDVATHLAAGIPAWSKTNVKRLFTQAYGVTNPLSSTNTANRFLVTNSSGQVTTDANVAYTSTGLTFGMNTTLSGSANFTMGTGILSIGTPNVNQGILRVGGTTGIGYFGFYSGADGITRGFGSGIRTESDNSVRFQTTNQGGVVNNWSFENFASVVRDWNQNSNIINIQQGWGNGSNSNIAGNSLAITGTINRTSNATGTKIRGIYYNPTLTSLSNSTHIAMETTSGDVLLGTTSGSLGVGVNTSINPSAIADFTSTTKGLMPPRMTKAQRDLVVTGVANGTVSGGSGYTIGVFAGVSLTGGTGSGAVATIIVTGGVVTTVIITTKGGGYAVSDVLSASLAGGSGFTYTVSALTNSPGVFIYQTDNTPGIYWFDGTNWLPSSANVGHVTATDANTSTVNTTTWLTLPSITANRTATIANGTYDQQVLLVWNKNANAFNWLISGAVIDAGGNAISSFVNQTFYRLVWDAATSAWIKSN